MDYKEQLKRDYPTTTYKSVVGHKSKTALVSRFIVMIISIVAEILFIFIAVGENEIDINNVLIIILGLIIIYLIYYCIREFPKPKNMVECDNKGIYLNYTKKTIFISYNDVIDIKYDIMYRNKFKIYGLKPVFSGWLRISSVNGDYRIGVVSDVMKAAQHINELTNLKDKYIKTS